MEKSQNLAPESFTIVCDERCTVVRSLGRLLKLWDRQALFTFVDRDSPSREAQLLIKDLDESPWSLFLIDDQKVRWYGPDAIPIILKNLPSGKFAAVFYILPGTMWLTRNLYFLVSNFRLLFTGTKTAASS